MPLLRIGAATVYVRDAGSERAPAVVLLHRAGGSGLDWTAVCRRLASHETPLRTVAIDLPGHGRSPESAAPLASLTDRAALVREVLDVLGVETAIVTGHSMGGGIAMELARMEPRRVRSLVLVACALDLRVSQAIRTLLHERFALAARTIATASVSPGGATAAALDSLAASFWHASPAAVRQDFDACDAFDFTNHAQALRGPAFVVAGADDALISTERCRRLAGAIPGGHLDIVADAGHLVPIEQPEAIVHAIRRTGL